MLKFLLFLSSFSCFQVFASSSTILDSAAIKTFKFQAIVERGFDDNMPVLVYVDSNQYLVGEVSYDKYFRVIKGRLLRKFKKVEYPYLKLYINDYSTLADNTDQIRLLDIQEAIIYQEPIEEEKKACGDQMILTNGDTLSCKIHSIDDKRIEYKKCSDPLQRTFGKDKDRVQKIIYLNGTVHEMDNPSQEIDRKRKRRIGFAVLLTLLLATGFLFYVAIT